MKRDYAKEIENIKRMLCSAWAEDPFHRKSLELHLARLTVESRSPLHQFRNLVSDMAIGVAAGTYHGQHADDNQRVTELERLAAAVDEQLTGKRQLSYTRFIVALMEGETWLWHLADGGYSRLTVSIIDGPEHCLRLDRGLSLRRVVEEWDRQFPPMELK